MKRVWKRPAQVLSGLLLTAMCALPQAYTISARPGAVNYIEGSTFLNDNPVSDKNLKSVFLNTNDTLATRTGKAEILLTPGVFLRLGDNTEIRMVSPSLTDTKVEVLQGEIIVEATGLVKENNLQVLNHGAFVTILKNGLYRFTADNPPTAAVLEGKANVVYVDRKMDLKKGRQTILATDLRPQKFDTKQDDSLYAWSNIRSEYEAAASYRVARNASSGLYNGYSGYGYGFNSFGPGWYWDNGFNSYAWLPGAGSFYSPFGYGFYSPGTVLYAPVVTTAVYAGGYRGGHPGTGTNGVKCPVPISPKNPAAIGSTASSPYSNQIARSQAVRAYAASGTVAGAPVSRSGGGGGYSAARSGGYSAAPSSRMSSGGMSGAAGGHAGGGRSK